MFQKYGFCVQVGHMVYFVTFCNCLWMHFVPKVMVIHTSPCLHVLHWGYFFLIISNAQGEWLVYWSDPCSLKCVICVWMIRVISQNTRDPINTVLTYAFNHLISKSFIFCDLTGFMNLLSGESSYQVPTHKLMQHMPSSLDWAVTHSTLLQPSLNLHLLTWLLHCMACCSSPHISTFFPMVLWLMSHQPWFCLSPLCNIKLA